MNLLTLLSDEHHVGAIEVAVDDALDGEEGRAEEELVAAAEGWRLLSQVHLERLQQLEVLLGGEGEHEEERLMASAATYVRSPTVIWAIWAEEEDSSDVVEEEPSPVAQEEDTAVTAASSAAAFAEGVMFIAVAGAVGAIAVAVVAVLAVSV